MLCSASLPGLPTGWRGLHQKASPTLKSALALLTPPSPSPRAREDRQFWAPASKALLLRVGF